MTLSFQESIPAHICDRVFLSGVFFNHLFGREVFFVGWNLFVEKNRKALTVSP